MAFRGKPLYTFKQVCFNVFTRGLRDFEHDVFAHTKKKQFLLRREAITLYRDALRSVKLLDGIAVRREMKEWVRDEFDRSKHITDEVSRELRSSNE